MPGPARKPTTLKVLEGNRGKQKLHPEPQPVRIAPDPPEHLPAMARQMWHQLAPELDRLGLLTAIDGAALEAACVAYARAVAADAILNERGQTQEVKQWDKAKEEYVVIAEKARPEVAIADRSWRRFRSFCVEFGLTPASRGKLTAFNPGQMSLLDAFEEAVFASA